jgi:hypothetical protein
VMAAATYQGLAGVLEDLPHYGPPAISGVGPASWPCWHCSPSSLSWSATP